MPRRLEVVWEGQVIPFEAPDDASPAQIKTLAARALKASSPGKDFQSPVLARELQRELAPPKPKGELRATPYSLQNSLEDSITGALTGLGISDRTARRYGSKFTGALDFLTPVGAGLEADRARQSFQGGNYLGAAGHGALAALSAVPDLGPLAGKVSHSIIAPLFHGSPHAFDKFSLDKIGTGEGAQAYGHGLYFAENPAVAKDYQRVLSQQQPVIGGQAVRNAFTGDTEQVMAALERHFAGRDVSIPDAARRHTFSNDATDLIMEAIDEAGNDPAKAIAYLRDKAANEPERLFRTYVPMEEAQQVGAGYAKAADMLAENPFGTGQGHLYEVSLDANPEDFLDWDAPLSAQPKNIREAFMDNGAALPSIDKVGGTYIVRDKFGQEIIRANSQREAQKFARQVYSGADAYHAASIPDPYVGHNRRQQLTHDLPELGVAGIRYLDQGSRGALSGTRNYVVFDPSIIDILRRY